MHGKEKALDVFGDYRLFCMVQIIQRIKKLNGIYDFMA